MVQAKVSAILDVFEDAHAGRLDFFHARTLAYSIPGEMEKLKDVVESARQTCADGARGDARKRAALISGVGLWIMRRYDEAVEMLNGLEDAAGEFFLGLCRTELGDYESAVKSLESAAKAGEDEFACAMAIAEAKRRGGDVATAMAVVERYEKDYGDEADLHYQKGRCLGEDDCEAALDAFDRAVELDPQHTGALFRLAYWHDLRGNDEQAMDFYEKAAEIRPVRRGVLLNLGMLYEDHAKYAQAVSLYERVLEQWPTDAHARMYVKDARASVDMPYDELQERHQSRTAQLLRTPLSDFELSARSRSCLEKMNVRTLGDLARLTEDEVVESKNFGDTSLSELRALLRSKGMHFGMGREEAGTAVGGPVESELSGVLAQRIADMDFSVRGQKCMRSVGVETLGDLVECTEAELLQCQNFGQTSLDEVRGKLKELGLEMKS